MAGQDRSRQGRDSDTSSRADTLSQMSGGAEVGVCRWTGTGQPAAAEPSGRSEARRRGSWRRRSGALLVVLLLAPSLPPDGIAAGSGPAVATRTGPATAVGTAAAGVGLVGWDTFRRLDLLPYLTTQAETRQFSSFDRSGGNDFDGYDGRFTCRRTVADGCVLAEDSGAGEISSIWFTRFGGDLRGLGRLKVVLDGHTVLDANVQDVVDGNLGPPFSQPLVANASQSSGGAYVKVPMPYRTSMLVTVQANPGFYHLTYRHFPDAAGVTTFDPADRAEDVLARLRVAGTADPKPAMPGAVTRASTGTLAPGQQAAPIRLTGPGVVTALRIRLPQVTGHDPASDELLTRTRVRASFDGRTTVDAPLGEFFGSGLGAYPVRSLLFGMDPTAGGWYAAWWPMPYAREASVTLVNDSSRQLTEFELRVTAAPDAQWASALAMDGDAGHFTAVNRRGDTEPGEDWRFVELAGRGKFVGVSHTMQGTDPGGWGRTYLEGDERGYVDGALSPQVHGTGTEDFYEGGWYFERGPFSAPLTGHSAYEERERGCRYHCDAAYRVMLADAVAYRSHLRFGIEHGGTNLGPASYSSTAFLYARPNRAARPSDQVDVDDPASRSAHAYSESGLATETVVSSVFEGDNDHATVTDGVRSTSAAVSFRLAVDPANRGVILRRVTDQHAAYQSARVLVDGVPAGTWTQPLNNVHQRWLQDSFALPPHLTAGKTTVTVRLEPRPGAPAWTAAGYTALSIVAPLPRRSAGGTDVDGDGRDDVVAFAEATADVYVALSTGSAFGARTRWHADFAPAGQVPLAGDVNGDGRDDIVSLTRGSPGAAVDVALSTGSAFGPRVRWHDHFSPADETPALGDVNGDGRDDLVTFTHGSPWAVVYVALSTGTGFGPAQRWHDHFAVDGEDPAIGDVNGDGRDDLVTLTHGSPWAVVYVALSTGTGFGTAQQWHHFFSAAGETPRVGDVDGDGAADVLTFVQSTDADVYVALSAGSSFGPAALWHDYFAPAHEFPYVGDFDGNGRTDIVTFTGGAAADVFVAVSSGWSFGWGHRWHDGFGFAGEITL